MSAGGQLTTEEEQALAVGAERGDPDACRRLVEAFLPAIGGLARRYPSGIGITREELLQEGVTGLLFAARRYDPSIGTPFWAYASFWVRKGMQELVAEVTRPVALSDRAARSLALVRAAHREHLQAHGRDPTADDLARATGLTPAQIASLQAADRPPRGLQEPVDAMSDGRATVGEAIADPRAEQAYAEVLDRLELVDVRDSIQRLDERERVVVRAHYGLGQPERTLSEIGGALGVTGERARQIEAGALKKLRDALAAPRAVRPD